MMAIFSNVVEKFVELFMDDFSIFDSLAHDYFRNFAMVLKY